MRRDRFGFKGGSILLVGLLLIVSQGYGQAEDQGPKITGDVEVGGRSFPDGPGRQDRGKFEEYRDIPSGIFLEGFRLLFESADEDYSLELQAKEAAEEDQNFLLRSSRLGRYVFEFEWDQTPHVFSNTGRTPYRETSRGVYELPDFIQTNLQGTPGNLESFLTMAHDSNLETRWDKARVLLISLPTADLNLRAEYALTRKRGERPIGTTFFFTNQVELPEPIDQTVHDLNLIAGLTREWWQVQFGYHLSLFQNDVDVLVWDNPIRASDIVGGASKGRIDLPAENVAHTVHLSGAVTLPLRSRLTGNLSYGVRFQDDDFIPHTINSAISDSTLTLPAGSLDGEVHTRLANLHFSSHPIRNVSMNVHYRFYDFYDDTTDLTFPGHVRSDTLLLSTESATAGRFSYTTHNAGLDVGWRLLRFLSFKVDYDWKRWDRDERTRETPKTDEHTPKVSMDYTPLEWLLIRTSYAKSWRRIGDYNTFAHLAHTIGEDVGPDASQAQHILLRKYDEADRDRSRVDLLAQITLIETLLLTPTLSFRDDDYKDSFFGLQDDQSLAIGMDLSWTPMERLALYVSYVREEFDARQRSRYRAPPSQLQNTTYDWIAEIGDNFDTAGVILEMLLIPEKLDMLLGWNYSRSVSRMRAFNPVTPSGGTASQNTSATAADFPVIRDALHQLEASVRYRMTSAWFMRLRYLYEKFDITDFRTDTIEPFMGNIDSSSATSIYLGAQIRDYTAHIISYTVGYRF